MTIRTYKNLKFACRITYSHIHEYFHLKRHLNGRVKPSNITDFKSGYVDGH
jgi:hypothetical protein